MLLCDAKKNVEEFPAAFFSKKRVIELGSGTGAS
jgi:hypothetical protein